MGIAKKQFTGILEGIFTPGNVIRLYKTVPDETTEQGGEFLTGAGVENYTIADGDFTIANGVVQSAKTMMFYLYEGTPTTCEGFGVFSNSGELLYFGAFKEALQLDENDVPAIKKYNSTKGEGIQISITSTDESAATT